MRACLLSSSLLVSLFLLSGPTLPAQGKPAAADAYAGESFVIDRSDWVYSENADGTGYREHTVAVAIQSEAAVRTFGVIGIGFASASEHVEIHYARVRHKDGSVTETPASGALEQPEEVTREAPFYSDLKQMQLPIKGLRAGDTLEWQARIVRTKAEAPNEFWGSESFVSDDAVTMEETIELRVPTASAATVWTNPKLALKTVESVEGATKVYHWQSAQLKATTGPAAEEAKKAKKGKLLTPDEELDVEEGALPSVAWTTFKNWEAVGAWYRGLEGQRAVPDDEIKAKVAELTAGKTTEEDKVKAVYAYVSAQIRYIGVAFGIGRFQPHEAVDVLHNQYGDCKDKATLLSSMLAALGLHADSVLIGEGIRWNDAVPSPAAFNHLITRVPVGGREVWLDATQEVAPYEVLLFDLRDKPALVIPDQGAASVLRTPKDLPFAGIDSWKAVGALDKDGVSESHIVLTLRGDDEIAFRAAAHQVSLGQYDDLAGRIVASMGYGGKVSHAEFSRPEDTSEPLTMSFDYHREKAGGDWQNLRTVPQLLPVNLPMVDENEPPVATILIGAPHTEISDSEMKLPPGWTAELPEAIHEKTAWATYDQTFRFDKGTLYTERKLVVLNRKVPASEWKAYKKWTETIGNQSEPYIQLQRGYEARPASAPLPPPEIIAGPDKKDLTENANDSAETLIQKAYDAIQKLDPDKAKDLLKLAETKDPKAPRLWAARADLAMALGVRSEAMEDAKKEVALHPDEVEAYRVMFRAEQMSQDTTGLEDTLRKWAALDPEDPQPELALAAVLDFTKKYREAVGAATKGAALLPSGEAEKNENLQFLMGKDQIRAGMRDQGDATLTTLLKSTDDTQMMNNAAYELSEASLELPLDEEKIHTVLDRLSAETQAWTLDESTSTLRAKSSLLVATWDTMGWILFREGKATEAKTYIEAAVRNKPSDEVVKHLAQVDKTLGIDDKIRMKSLAKADLTVTSSIASEEQEMRTYPMGPANGRSGVAEYKILLSPEHVERIEATGSRTIAGAEESIKQVDFSKLFPAGSTAKLVKMAMVNCFGGKCMLVLEP